MVMCIHTSQPSQINQQIKKYHIIRNNTINNSSFSNPHKSLWVVCLFTQELRDCPIASNNNILCLLQFLFHYFSSKALHNVSSDDVHNN